MSNAMDKTLAKPLKAATATRFGVVARAGVTVRRGDKTAGGVSGIEATAPVCEVSGVGPRPSDLSSVMGISPQGLRNASDSARRGSPIGTKGRAWQACATIAPQVKTSVSSIEASSQFGKTPSGLSAGMMSQ